MRLDLPYLRSDRDRHGNRRYYVRRYGRSERIREEPGTAAFARAYGEAVERLARRDRPQGSPTPRITHPGSFAAVAQAYFNSPEFRALNGRSQNTRRSIIESCLREPLRPGLADLLADCPVARLTARHIQVLRDRVADRPGSANNRRKYLSALFGWAVEHGHMTSNPARDVRRVRYSSAGFHTWTIEEVKKFEERHPVGTKARLALALLLYLGVRRGDLVGLGRQHLKDGWISFVPAKTKYVRQTMSHKPVLLELAAVLASGPTGDLTFLTTEYGRPFTPAGFGAWFKKRCLQAGLSHCTAHGLRKAGATMAAEAGATDRQLMALYDWSTAAQANVYTKAASQRQLAGEAGKLIGGTK